VFCLEITESAIMDDPQRAESTLNALSSAGFKLSIDDFGTGYSSLAYLKRLPVHELKIDKSFVMAMERDADDAKIVRSTIDLAHNLGLSVVAEGIENAAVWDLLEALGCDEGQGFHMGRPLPAAELPAFAQRWSSRTLAASPQVSEPA
jgi:EAL domain-containing protein (putative c-di-GMP-specific phosphodiesterase class I)